MVILDTNVVSELMRDEPSSAVLDWVNAQPTNALFVTTITEAEIGYGVAIMPAGKRRELIAAACQRLFGELFLGRVLSFDRGAACAYPPIAARRRSKGLSGGALDLQIAAIAMSNGAMIGTRNVGDFLETGIEVINPWASEISRT